MHRRVAHVQSELQRNRVDDERREPTDAGFELVSNDCSEYCPVQQQVKQNRARKHATQSRAEGAGNRVAQIFRDIRIAIDTFLVFVGFLKKVRVPFRISRESRRPSPPRVMLVRKYVSVVATCFFSAV